MIKTGFEKQVPFTHITDYTPEDIDDLGEAGIINESLKTFYSDSTYQEQNTLYKVGRVNDVEVKVVPEDCYATVYLYGTLDLSGVA